MFADEQQSVGDGGVGRVLARVVALLLACIYGPFDDSILLMALDIFLVRT